MFFLYIYIFKYWICFFNFFKGLFLFTFFKLYPISFKRFANELLLIKFVIYFLVFNNSSITWSMVKLQKSCSVSKWGSVNNLLSIIIFISFLSSEYKEAIFFLPHLYLFDFISISLDTIKAHFFTNFLLQFIFLDIADTHLPPTSNTNAPICKIFDL